MGDLDAVALAEEEHGVVADHVPTAQGLHADLGVGPWTDVAVARVASGGRELAAAALGGRLAEAQGRARRRIALGTVVGLDNLDVVARPEASATSLSMTFTPTDMLGASTMGTVWAATAIFSLSAAERPVVPMTMAAPAVAAAAALATVAAGAEKSIHTSAAPLPGRRSTIRTPAAGKPANCAASAAR